MPDLEEQISRIEAAILAAREDDGRGRIDEDGATEAAIKLGEIAALRRRYKTQLDLLTRATKILDAEIMALLDIGETVEIAGLSISHASTTYFDKAAWVDYCRGPFGDRGEKEAIEALDRYLAAEKLARKSESITKSGGVRVKEAKL